jgi:hypothetical protein
VLVTEPMLEKRIARIDQAFAKLQKAFANHLNAKRGLRPRDEFFN